MRKNVIFLLISLLRVGCFQNSKASMTGFLKFATKGANYREREMGHSEKIIYSARVEGDNEHDLLAYVISTFPNVKREQAKRWLSSGSIFVNGEPQSKFNLKLFQSDQVVIKSGNFPAELSKQSIIYEDGSMVAVIKPIGITSSSSPLLLRLSSPLFLSYSN
jgi:hypothetical protein